MATDETKRRTLIKSTVFILKYANTCPKNHLTFNRAQTSRGNGVGDELLIAMHRFVVVSIFWI